LDIDLALFIARLLAKILRNAMLNILAKIVCFIAGHDPQPGYPENYQDTYCGTCGIENPPYNRMHLTAFGAGMHNAFSKFYWFVISRLEQVGGKGYDT
jgi:hypothetical protein